MGRPKRSATRLSWKFEMLIDGTMSFLLSPDNSTGVLRIESFSFDESITWAFSIYTALLAFQEAGVQNLIVDVVGNGGGNVCLGYETMSLLVKDYYDTLRVSGRAPSGVYDWKATESIGRFFTKFGNVFGYIDPETSEPYEDGSFYTDGPEHRRGGSISRYSKPFEFDCSDLTSNFSLPEDLPVWFEPERILMLTDGLCGSTCSTFLSHMQENNKARVAGVGGLKYQALQSQSFAGGFVTNVDVLNQLLTYAGEPTIPAFPTKVSWQLAWGELYAQKQNDQPLQFSNLPADFNLDYWQYDESSVPTWIELYELAMESFVDEADNYRQCGGDTYDGPTVCGGQAWSCFKKDEHFSQCRKWCPAGWDCGE